MLLRGNWHQLFIGGHGGAGTGEQRQQWQRWRDLKSAFDKFFTLNPEAVSWRHNYGWYAYHCAVWDEFNKQLPLLGPINHSYFGGEKTFERMVSNARERGSKPPTN